MTGRRRSSAGYLIDRSIPVTDETGVMAWSEGSNLTPASGFAHQALSIVFVAAMMPSAPRRTRDRAVGVQARDRGGHVAVSCHLCRARAKIGKVIMSLMYIRPSTPIGAGRLGIGDRSVQRLDRAASGTVLRRWRHLEQGSRSVRSASIWSHQLGRAFWDRERALPRAGLRVRLQGVHQDGNPSSDSEVEACLRARARSSPCSFSMSPAFCSAFRWRSRHWASRSAVDSAEVVSASSDSLRRRVPGGQPGDVRLCSMFSTRCYSSSMRMLPTGCLGRSCLEHEDAQA